MTLHAWPLDSPDATAPAYYGRRLRATTVVPHLAGARPGRPLGVRSGVRPGTPDTTVTVAGITWTVRPCAGVIEPHSDAASGAYTWAIEDDVTGQLAAASGTYTRWDGVYVVIDDPAEGDGTAVPDVRVQYVAGTAAPSPSLPTAPARSLRLARIVVPPSGAGDPTVVWDPPVLAAAGGIIPARATADLLPYGTPDCGQIGDVAGSLYRSDGSTVTPLVQRPADGTSIVTALGAVFAMGTSYPWRIYQAAGTATLEAARIARASSNLTMVAGTDYNLVSAGGVPAALRPARDTGALGYTRSSGGIVPTRVVVGADGAVRMMATAQITLTTYNPDTGYVETPAITWALPSGTS